MSEQANESGENVSEIQRLTARAHDLNVSIGNWNNAYMILVALTVLLAAGVFITQFVANKKSRSLAEIQDALIAEKDTEAAVDSKAKDGKIADALKTAGDSNERAGEAQERAANLELQALKLREQLVAQGPRENFLRGENRQKLVNALKAFTGQRIDVRRSAAVFEVNGAVVMSTPVGDDVLGLANALIGTVKDAGWKSPPAPLLSDFVGQGINVMIVNSASPETLRAASVLVRSLRAVPLAVAGPYRVDQNRAKRVGKDATLPAFDENTIVLEVMSHP